MPSMNLLQTSTGPIAYDIRGEGHPVVLLASGGHDHRDYDELRELLPPRFQSIAPDWPAHGDSPPGEGPATETRFADITEELVAALAPDGAVVVGNSVGGYAATRLAIRHPDLVRGLVIIDAGGFEGRSLKSRLFNGLMGRPWFLRGIYPSFSKRYMRPRTAADRRAREAAIATTRGDPGLRAVSELWRSFSLASHDLLDGALTITAPTLILWGRHDPVLPVKVARQLAAAMPDARLAEFDTGHVPHTTDPAGVAAHLVPFLDAAFNVSSPIPDSPSGSGEHPERSALSGHG
jgi:pimeloyl-ACP methyl ester carboxylesterase